MPAYFFDASALVKRYLRETGSNWIRQLINRGQPRIFISSLSGAEVLAAMMRKGRTQEARPVARDRAVRAFRSEFATSYALIAPGPAVIHKAMDLILSYPLRGYDAVQLASVLALPVLPDGVTPIFVSADEGLLTVATELGVSTENPNRHP
ncbi:MAG: type II toxin-antitoxin system VapC family toxin [Nitrospinae bacterium]|nr:type II toxin-antitoxin system VapC family toxin [Nitrospinota bacterium]